VNDSGSPTRIQRVRARAEAWREEATERLEQTRQRSGFVDALVRAWERDSEVGGGLMGGALAFRIFLFLAPLVMVTVTLTGAAATVSSASPDDLARRAGIGGVLAKAVVDVESIGTTQRMVVMLVSLYVLLSTARTVVASLVSVHVLVWRLPKTKIKGIRPALLLIGFVLLTSFASTTLGQIRDAAPAPGLALTIAWVLLPLAAWWWASSHLPHGDAPTWALLPGAVVFAVGMQVLHLVTVYYVSGSAVSKSERYGAAGIALAVLFWAYLAGRLITATAVVNATLWRRFTDRDASDPASGDGASEERSGLAHWVRSAAGLLR
jgi:uncharacterized BrkB/YihY/UPF0761 family membrane protein